jgi:hypothetical protein
LITESGKKHSTKLFLSYNQNIELTEQLIPKSRSCYTVIDSCLNHGEQKRQVVLGADGLPLITSCLQASAAGKQQLRQAGGLFLPQQQRVQILRQNFT